MPCCRTTGFCSPSGTRAIDDCRIEIDSSSRLYSLPPLKEGSWPSFLRRTPVDTIMSDSLVPQSSNSAARSLPPVEIRVRHFQIRQKALAGLICRGVWHSGSKICGELIMIEMHLARESRRLA
jgi:hypothetical protein